MNYSIVWKIRENGAVTFRRDLDDMPSLADALAKFRREEPEAYIVRAYVHEQIHPELLAGVLNHVEQTAAADGWRSLGD